MEYCARLNIWPQTHLAWGSVAWPFQQGNRTLEADHGNWKNMVIMGGGGKWGEYESIEWKRGKWQVNLYSFYDLLKGDVMGVEGGSPCSGTKVKNIHKMEIDSTQTIREPLSKLLYSVRFDINKRSLVLNHFTEKTRTSF